ncbi:MAG: L,D-transpeptidase [Chloroflexota bacterium]|nr:MAG: L,D-transpeptidase [Chloroflexota bacterium]
MSKNLSRRDFLKLGGLSLGSLAFTPFVPRTEVQDYGNLGRVTISEVDVYGEPRDGAEIVGKRYRDQLVQIYYELEPPDAPVFYNKLWYRVWGGYIHSSYLQKVDINFNKPLTEINELGQLAEVTVPYSQSYTYSQFDGWQVEYRLYYETTHWITDVDQGPDGRVWYQLTDELQPWSYWVPADHLRPISAEEIAPITQDIPAAEKHIEVDLARQTLVAYEQNQVVFQTRVSTGIPSSRPTSNGIPTETPKGSFNIYSKMPSKHMGDGRLMQGDLNLDAYELVGVPWTMFFHRLDTGYALHGTYWHNNFGWQMSHGCINLRNDDAKWLFRWTTPVNHPAEVEKNGFGTRVIIY